MDERLGLGDAALSRVLWLIILSPLTKKKKKPFSGMQNKKYAGKQYPVSEVSE